MPSPKKENLARETANTKYCSACSCVKPLEEFPRSGSGRKGRRNVCKPCHCKEKREYYEEKGHDYRRAIDRKSWLMKAYGLTLDDYQKMWDAQGGLCAICHEPEVTATSWKKFTNYLAVDHDHVTGKIRGLLCNNCNRAIGLLRDSPAHARVLADYLEQYA